MLIGPCGHYVLFTENFGQTKSSRKIPAQQCLLLHPVRTRRNIRRRLRVAGDVVEGVVVVAGVDEDEGEEAITVREWISTER